MNPRAEVVQFIDADGGTIAIEVIEPRLPTGFIAIGRDSGDKKISYREAIDQVKPAADYLLQSISQLDAAPAKVEVSFGIKLSTKAGAVIASAAAEGNFSVKLTWQRDKQSG